MRQFAPATRGNQEAGSHNLQLRFSLRTAFPSRDMSDIAMRESLSVGKMVPCYIYYTYLKTGSRRRRSVCACSVWSCEKPPIWPSFLPSAPAAAAAAAMIVVKAHRSHLDEVAAGREALPLSPSLPLSTPRSFARRFYLVNCAREHERLATPPARDAVRSREWACA